MLWYWRPRQWYQRKEGAFLPFFPSKVWCCRRQQQCRLPSGRCGGPGDPSSPVHRRPLSLLVTILTPMAMMPTKGRFVSALFPSAGQCCRHQQQWRLSSGRYGGPGDLSPPVYLHPLSFQVAMMLITTMVWVRIMNVASRLLEVKITMGFVELENLNLYKTRMISLSKWTNWKF